MAPVPFVDVAQLVNWAVDGLPPSMGNETHTGWVLGGGLAYAVSDQIIARVENAHMDFGSENHELSAGGFSIGDEANAEIDTVRLGVRFKFGGDRRAPVEPLK